MLAGITFALMLHQDALKVEDVKVGTGPVVKAYDVVEVHYIGTLMDGKEFDSSVKKNKTFRFQVGVGRVIKGWDQGVAGMKVGGERNLIIPPALGYGDKAMGDLIPANSTLKFNVKLIRIVPAVKIEVITPGKGDALKPGEFLECKLSVKLPDGKELAKPDEVSQLAFNPNMIPGLNQAIVGIKAGEKQKVVMGYELAFGEKGSPPQDTPEAKAGSMVPPKTDITVVIEALKISS